MPALSCLDPELTGVKQRLNRDQTHTKRTPNPHKTQVLSV